MVENLGTGEEEKLLSILSSETRRSILSILSEREATAEEIADELGKSPQTIYYHLRILRKAGLIDYEEIRKGHLLQKRYYLKRRDVRVFLSVKAKEKLKAILRDVAGLIREMGLEIEDEEEFVDKVSYYLSSLDGFMGKEKEMYSRFREKLSGVDTVTAKLALDIVSLASLSEEELGRYVKMLEEFWHEIRRMLGEKLVGRAGGGSERAG